MHSTEKTHHHRRRSRSGAIPNWVIAVVVVLILAMVVGIILALNSKFFIAPH